MTSRASTHSLSTLYPNIPHQRIVEISRLSLSQRSALIKCCQAQTPPIPNTPLFNILASTNSDMLRMDVIRVANALSAHLTSPLESAILLDIIRCCPLPDDQIDEARAKSWAKELKLSEGLHRPEKINWRCIFQAPQYAHEPLLPSIPPNPLQAKYCYIQLLRFRNRWSGRTLFPRATHKNMSRSTRRCYESDSGDSLVQVPIFGQDDWCRYYHQTGIQLPGCCEMRQVWTASQAKPRTYFCQGGHTYRHSRFLQDFFTDLVNSFHSTHHVSRLRPSRLLREDEHHFLIYDLSNFTSNCVEQRGFVRNLAEFCMGQGISVMDERLGVDPQDLGDMLYSYLEECVTEPILSYERCFTGWFEEVGHGVASLLGIFGNLMTCTAAHGIAILQLYEDELRSNIAGDDGAADDEPLELPEVITAIGDWEPTKCFGSDDPGAIALKRPLYESYRGLTLGINIVPPTAALLFALSGKADPRYTFYSLDDMSEVQRITVVGKDLLRCIRSFWRARSTCSLSDLFCLQGFYKSIAKQFKATAGYPICGDPYFFPLYPTDDIMFGETDPIVCLAYARFRDVVTLPAKAEEDQVVVASRIVNVGDVEEGWTTQHVTFLKRLGYFEAEQVQRTLYGVEGFYELLSFIRFEYRILYRVNCVRDVPQHLLL